jgi:putative peptidoglycan lipid II flippase
MTERKDIAKRAGMVSFFTFISRILGLVRDMAIASAFGTQAAADAFFVAFRIPNLLRRLFAEGALTVSFVPVFTEYLKKPRDEVKKVVDATFTFQCTILVLVALIGVVFSPWLVKLTAWGFSRDPDKFALTVYLTRVMFPYIVLISLAAWAMGILNTMKHFSSPAASPIFMNLGIILGATVLIRYFDPPVLGLAIGVLIGGVMQLGCHFPFLGQFGFLPRFRWDPRHPAIKRILGMMAPAAYGAAVYQFNVLAGTFLASFLPTGSVSYLWYADRVMEFPLGIFAVSLATVILPTLSDHATEKNFKALKETFAYGLRMIFFITVPAGMGLIVLADEIIRTLFHRGHFSDLSVTATAGALTAFAVGLPFISGVRVTSNAFYSMQDSRTPVRVATMAVLVDLVLSIILMRFFGHVGIAMAVTSASIFNFTMHLIDFRKKVGPLGLRRLGFGLLKTLIAAGLMGGAVWSMRRFVPLLPGREGTVWNVIRLGAHIGAGAAVYFLAAVALRMEEIEGFRKAIRRRRSGIPPPPTVPPADADATGDVGDIGS